MPGVNMRRKCLAVTIVIILVLTLFHSLDIPLREDQLLFLEGEAHWLEGTVTKIERREKDSYQMEVQLLSWDGREFDFMRKEKILLSYYKEIESPWEICNRRICFYGALEEPAGRRNPGCFDYGLYLKSRGIFKTAVADSFQVKEEKNHFYTRFVRFLIKGKFQYTDHLDEVGKGLITGVLFGDTDSMEESVYETFRNNGTAHILAVSGLHVGILYGIYKTFAGKRKNYIAIFLLAVMVFSYGTVSLWSPSVLRASLMIGFSVTARALDLRYDMITALSAVALILIWENPYVIFGAGFQMSFLAILSIGFLKPMVPKKVPDGMALVLAVNGGLTLYQMYQFNYISFVSVFVNIPVVFLTGILVPVAFISFLLFLAVGDSGIAGYLTDRLAFLLMKINQWSSFEGYGAMDVISPPLWLVAGLYLFVFFWASEYRMVLSLRGERRKLKVWIAGILFYAAVVGAFNDSPVADADLVFVDVGQGDCLHVRSEGNHMLIDGGGNMNYNIGKNTLKPYLLKNGVRRIDAALATHLHTDHFLGLEQLKEEYPVEKLWTGMIKGDQLRLSNQVLVKTLWPLSIDGDTGQEENYQCSVFMIYFGPWKVLITGDLDEEGEKKLLKEYKGTDMLKADILKIGHHGSKSSTCDAFLEEVDPTFAVIQVGEGNRYGHPDRKVIEKCEKKGIMVLRNDKDGAIGFSFTSDQIKVCRMIE